MRQLRLRSGDLDPIGKGYLEAYVQLRAKIDLIDGYVAANGLLREDGEPQPALKLYVSLQNSARLALGRLEAHFNETLGDPVMELNAYLDAKAAGGGA